jgi:CHASE2 domain-containing sensor protein
MDQGDSTKDQPARGRGWPAYEELIWLGGMLLVVGFFTWPLVLVLGVVILGAGLVGYAVHRN